MNTINPFKDSGITNYDQYQKYNFLILGDTLKQIQKSLTQNIKEIKLGYFVSERLLLVGERGLGKTTTLFYIKNLLEKENIKVFYFTKLIEDKFQLHARIRDELMEKYSDIELVEKRKGEEEKNLFKEPTYILIDFPDSVDTSNLRKFLNYLWELITDKNYDKINLIFAMNRSHYVKSDAISEILGKFTRLTFNRFNYNETVELIESRLELVNKKIDDVFDEDILSLIQEYSKGIPRNIIYACRFMYDGCNGGKINKEDAERIMREDFIAQIINDRVQDPERRTIFYKMTKILKEDFEGKVEKKEDFVRKVMDDLNIGRNFILDRIKDLQKMGIVSEYRGGHNRTNKILAFTEKDSLK